MPGHLLSIYFPLLIPSHHICPPFPYSSSPHHLQWGFCPLVFPYCFTIVLFFLTLPHSSANLHCSPPTFDTIKGIFPPSWPLPSYQLTATNNQLTYVIPLAYTAYWTRINIFFGKSSKEEKERKSAQKRPRRAKASPPFFHQSPFPSGGIHLSSTSHTHR